MQVVGLLVFTYFTGLQGVPKFPDPDCRTDDGHSGRMLGSGVMLSQIRICSLPTLNPKMREAVVYMVCMCPIEGAER